MLVPGRPQSRGSIIMTEKALFQATPLCNSPADGTTKRAFLADLNAWAGSYDVLHTSFESSVVVVCVNPMVWVLSLHSGGMGINELFVAFPPLTLNVCEWKLLPAPFTVCYHSSLTFVFSIPNEIGSWDSHYFMLSTAEQKFISAIPQVFFMYLQCLGPVRWHSISATPKRFSCSQATHGI